MSLIKLFIYLFIHLFIFCDWWSKGSLMVAFACYAIFREKLLLLIELKSKNKLCKQIPVQCLTLLGSSYIWMLATSATLSVQRSRLLRKKKLENLKTQNVPFKTFHQIKQQQRRATLPIDSNSHEPKRIVMEFDLVPWAVTNVAFAISSWNRLVLVLSNQVDNKLP